MDAAKAKRDAIQAQYDLENRKLQQLQDAYAKVNSAIGDINNSLQTMGQAAQDAIDKAKAAGGAGAQNIAGQNFDAAAGGNYPTANLGGNLGTGAGGLSIDDLTKAAIENTRKAFGKLDLLTPVKKKWQAVVNWWKANVAPGLAEFGHAVASGLGKIDLGKAFQGIADSKTGKFLADFGHVIGTVASAFGKLFGPEIVKLAKTLFAQFGEFGKHVMPQLLPLLTALGRLFSLIWTIVKPIAAVVGIVLLGALKIFASVLNGVLGPALKMTFTLLGNFLQILTGLINFIVFIFTGQWSKAWHALVSIVAGVFAAIGNVIKGAWNVIFGFVKGLVEGIVNFFKWLYDTLVGHSIIPDLIRKITHLFTGLPMAILRALAKLGSIIISPFTSAYNTVKHATTVAINSVVSFFSGLPGRAKSALHSLLGTLGGVFSNAFAHVKDVVKDAMSAVVSAVSGLPGRLGRLAGSLASAGKGIMSHIWGGIKSFVGAAGDVASSIGHSILRMIDKVIPHTITIPGIHISVLGKHIGAGPWGPYTVIPHFAAKGGIFDQATNLVVGEAGREAVIPLNDPQRAWDLIQRSGLTKVLSNYMRSKTNGDTFTASARVNAANATEDKTPIIHQTNIETKNYYFGDLSMPNIKSGADAETFLKNLESLVGGK